MVHPFDVELGDDGRLYVSCQDTNTVLAVLTKTRAAGQECRITGSRAASSRRLGLCSSH